MKKRKAKKRRRLTMYRDAKTGIAVSKSYADKHPATTVRETRLKNA